MYTDEDNINLFKKTHDIRSALSNETLSMKNRWSTLQ